MNTMPQYFRYSKTILAVMLTIFTQQFTFAQGFTNFGNLHFFNGANVNTLWAFTNSATTGNTYVNDGYFYVKANYTSNEANMISTCIGTTEFDGTTIQNLTGTNIAQFGSIKITNNIGGLLPSLAYTFALSRNWENNGVFKNNKSTVNYNGTAPQNITGTVKTIYWNFSNLNNTNVTLAQNVDLLNVFAFKNCNNAALNSNGFLTAKSSDTLTAQIADKTDNNILTGNMVNGNVIVERYVPGFASGRKWRLYSIPTNTIQSVRASWMEGAVNDNDNPLPGFGTIVTDEKANAVANGFDSRSVSGPSVKYYDVATNTYIGVPTPSYIISNQRCYFSFIRGDRTSKPLDNTITNTILRTTGPIKQDAINQNFNANEINTVGNPYASRIDLRKINHNNMTDYIYIWDPKITGIYGLGAYQTLQFDGTNYIIMPGGGSYGAGGSTMNFVESSQGFFMKAKSSATTLSITEIVKTSGSNNVSLTGGNGAESKYPTMRAFLSFLNGSDAELLDGVQAEFSNVFSNDVNFEDGEKFTNTNLNFSITKSNQKLVYERRHVIDKYDTIQFNLANVRLGNFELNLNFNKLYKPNIEAHIKDNFLNTLTPINLSGTQKYNFTISNNIQSYQPNRLSIIFKKIPFTPPTIIANATLLPNNQAQINYTVNNELEVNRYIIEHGKDAQHFEPIAENNLLANNGITENYSITNANLFAPNNFYRVKIINNDSSIIYSNVTALEANNDDIKISVFPNPIVGKTFTLTTQNLLPATYTLTLTNTLGQTLHTSTFKNSFAQNNTTVTLNKPLPSGMYIITILAPNGLKTTYNLLQ